MAAQKAQAPAPKAQPAAVKPPAQSQAPGSQTAAAQQYMVQSNETLWGIASRMAAQQNRPVSEVMKQIKASNQHAFIQGDANRLRSGVSLNLGPAAAPKEPVRVPAAELAKVPSAQSGKTKYRLNQAEMSLVAEKAQDSARTSANEATEKNQTSNGLSLKVMTSREKTVKLQRNVTQLELALNQKDHRIQLLNARLAQLQQQLKARQAEKKPIN
jgi:Tfp pilus assembly protein FimV